MFTPLPKLNLIEGKIEALRRYKTMGKTIKKILKWYGLPIGLILGNLTSDYSFQIFGICVLLGYLAGSFIYITDDKD